METKNRKDENSVCISKDYCTLNPKAIRRMVLRGLTVILLPAHPASFAHNFVSGMQSFYFSESQDVIVL